MISSLPFPALDVRVERAARKVPGGWSEAHLREYYAIRRVYAVAGGWFKVRGFGLRFATREQALAFAANR